MSARRRTRQRRRREDDARQDGAPSSPGTSPSSEQASHPLLRAQARLGNTMTRRMIEAPAGEGALQVRRQFTEEDVIALPPMEITAEPPAVESVEQPSDLLMVWSVILETLDMAGQSIDAGTPEDLGFAFELVGSALELVLLFQPDVAALRPEAADGVEAFREGLDALFNLLQAHALAAVVPLEGIQEILDTLWNDGAALTLALQGLEDIEGSEEHA